MSKDRKLDRHKKVPGLCIQCKENFIGRRNRKFCSMECFKKFNVGENHCCWKGGIRIAQGYRTIRQDDKTYKFEHVIAAEKALERPMKKGEVVHHLDGDKLNNKNNNLLICDRNYHLWLEQRMSYLYKREHFGCIHE